MNTTTSTDGIVIEEGSGNPYADLGRPDADDMLIKAGLAQEVAAIIKSRQLTQLRAAELLGMQQPKLSDLLRGKFRGISQAKMIECLNRLGCDVNIVVRKKSQHAPGQTLVVVA
ncbi:XRE family transcriptional regulator [Oxalobacteraceae bacterium]|nr:XRE family transcriptional regulator [Oxalobacteraceae bacterium]